MSVKQNAKLLKFYKHIVDGVLKTATRISPALNTKLRYRIVHKKKLNLKNPKTFNEKLLWLKLYRYANDPLVIQCADKYLVRDYIRRCGFEDILVELIGVWDTADQIPWDVLPQKFVLKWNFGAGMNIICQDKCNLDQQEVVKKMHDWGKEKCWLGHSEIHYKYIPKKIVCEEFLEGEDGGGIPDYKVYCFHGEPKAIFVMHDRFEGKMKTEFFDVNWNPLENSSKYGAFNNRTPKPACLDRLLKISAALSKPFPFVRCDFYVLGNRIYFGELTFTPAGGMYTSQTQIDGKNMTEYLYIELEGK